jgi:hypothetical protein
MGWFLSCLHSIHCSFGSLEADVGGRPPPLGGPRERMVLGVLLLETGRTPRAPVAGIGGQRVAEHAAARVHYPGPD